MWDVFIEILELRIFGVINSVLFIFNYLLLIFVLICVVFSFNFNLYISLVEWCCCCLGFVIYFNYVCKNS